MRNRGLVKVTLTILWIAVFQFRAIAFSPETNVSFPELKGYKIVQEYPVYVPDDLWDYINGGADAYLNYGFTDLHIAEYVKGETSIKVEVYHHKDNVYAFGMYALERGPDYHYIKLGVQAYAENSLVNFVKGPWYVKVSTYNEDEETGKILLKLAESLEKNLKGSDKLPDIFTCFPEDGKILNSESFIASSFLGYSFLNEVFTTSYEQDGNSFKLFVLVSESNENSMETEKELLSKAKSSNPVEGGSVFMEDKYNGEILIKRVNNRIFGCMNNPDVKLFNSNVDHILRSVKND
jgi:hypothetical protein